MNATRTDEAGSMQWRVGLENYEVRAAHGWFEHEHETPQPFVFTVWATLAVDQRIEGIEETLNYADVQIAVDEVVLKASKPIRLMEDMAQRVVDLLAARPAVASVSVRIEKPEAPLPHAGGLPVIEVVWHRN